MIYPGTEVVLTSLQLSGTPFLLFLKIGWMFPLFQSLGLGLSAMTFQMSWRVALQQHQPVPSGP